MARTDLNDAITLGPHPAGRGRVELVLDDDHLQRVVLGGMLAARTSLVVATADFKAMQIPRPGRRQARSIVGILRDLARDGVETRLLHAGVPSGPVLHDLRKPLPAEVVIRRCPRLHTKCVIVDCAWMYLGSANLTGAGLGAKSPGRRNFEAGITTRDPELIDPVLEYFNAIWEGRHCESCGRRDVCPVPLEEPELT